MVGRTKLVLSLSGVLVAVASLSNFRTSQAPSASSDRSAAKPAESTEDRTVRFLQTPEGAVRAALADALTLPPDARPYVRYVWVQDGDVRSWRTSSLALAYLNRSAKIARPLPVADGRLLRVDLRLYVRAWVAGDLQDWIKYWEELAFDPTFALLVTKDTLDLLSKEFRGQLPPRRVFTTRKSTRQVQERDAQGRPLWYYKDGVRGRPSMVDEEYEEQVEEYQDYLSGGKDVARFNGQHIDAAAFAQLQDVTGSLAPVVEHRYFKSRVLATIKEANVNGKVTKSRVFRTVFGGLYYELRGIRLAKDALGKDTKATDLDLYFEELGIGNIAAGVTAEKLFDRLGSDRRLAVFRSQVTGKPRDVCMFNTPENGDGSSWGAITGDVADEDVDIGDRSYANLLNPRRAAREAIFPGASGFHVFGLFNGEGARQDEVPFNIAADSTIPGPHTRRLQAAIGCIRCHGTDGSDGFKPLVNDVKRLLKSVDAFDDRSRRDPTGAVDRLHSLYSGDFSKNLRRGRDDLAEVTLRATGPWSRSEDQTDAAKLAAARLSDEYAEYNYDAVDARAALKELGVLVPASMAKATFAALLPPDSRAEFGGVILEDSRIAMLRDGGSVNRADWALVYSFAAERSKQRLRQLAESSK